MENMEHVSLKTRNNVRVNHSIRRIEMGEVALYRQVRLTALKEAPEAFCTTYAEAMARDEESWRAQADENASSDDRALFLARANEETIGLAGVYREESATKTGELCQVWVAPAYRRTGVAVGLMDVLMAWAVERDFRQILATIRAGNERALRFYRTYGFVNAEGVVGPLPGDTVLVREIDTA